MLVRHLCYCLKDTADIATRQQDHDADNIVKCLKGVKVDGLCSLVVDGARICLQEGSGEQSLALLWKVIGEHLKRTATADMAIVPIPNQDGVVDAPANYRTLRYAEAIAANSSGRLVAVDALRWKPGTEPAYKWRGPRSPEARYNKLVVTKCPQSPILLFDDTIFSGSSFIAANWHLDEWGNAPQYGYVIARRTAVQQGDMFKAEERELPIPRRDFASADQV